MTVPRVALVTPFAHPSVRGNAITVERIARSLRGHGVALRLWDRSALPEATLEEEVAEFKPTLVHAFHGFRVGPLALRVARQLGVPLVVTTFVRRISCRSIMQSVTRCNFSRFRGPSIFRPVLTLYVARLGLT